MYRNGGRPFVEQWRRDILGYQWLRRGWARIEELGEGDKWTKNAETEEEWAEVMFKVNEWEKEWEAENRVPFQSDLDFYGVD